MWQIVFSTESLVTLDIYIEGYQSYFLDRFSDTGIWGEDIIRKNYEEQAIQLYEAIYSHILVNMKRELIGYEPGDTGVRTTATFLGKRIIFIEYEEDVATMTRYVLTMKIIYR